KSIFTAVDSICPSARGELEITDAIQWLQDNGKVIEPHKVSGWWKDTGKPNDLLEANRLVLDNIITKITGNVDKQSQISGRVIIEKGCQIQNSNIRGPVIIGAGTKIINAYIGPYTSIERNCTIKDSEIEYSIVSEDCEITDQKIRIEASLLGKGVKIIEAKSKPFTNRFIIGDQSLVEIR
ncbi:glucose-1-phosphate thymidylyltransferase, partial [bacterium]|nr:glucose-1-phosphate thymidylyltransferase [bacterium]